MEEAQEQEEERQGQGGRAMVMLICGSLIYYHCAFRNSSLLSLLSDVFLVILCSLAILGLLFRHFNISVPVDPLEWQLSQDTANKIFATLANTVGAAESVLRVAATGHDKRLFCRVVLSLYALSVLGRMVSGATVAYAEERLAKWSRLEQIKSISERSWSRLKYVELNEIKAG
ncbi:hypothetical protein Cgig2_028955 [Carnegiea gigantea]|uniref:Reticulon domain-containing protein n=1 Tax=Carnegiea gigantea TaxID=171969 RepID=A0A9Q1JVC0_9CARY|nr:hypothetical protein Cgig2_028955 [Carnegiea gigantea]